MASSFVYTIADDIPGGVFGGAESNRLLALINAEIETQLSNISTSSGTLTVTFVTDITAEEKAILDGNTLGPAGGLVGDSADKIEITLNSTVLSNSDESELTPDGIQSLTFECQLKDGFGAAKGSERNEIVSTQTNGLVPIDTLNGNLDANGQYSFVVGPTFSRGTIELTMEFENLPTRFVNVNSK